MMPRNNITLTVTFLANSLYTTAAVILVKSPVEISLLPKGAEKSSAPQYLKLNFSTVILLCQIYEPCEKIKKLIRAEVEYVIL
jgi:hypothetical protein